MIKDTCPRWVVDYAMDEAKRLHKLHPVGLTSEQTAEELGLKLRSAVSTMCGLGFKQHGGMYRIGDVAALLAYREYKKQKRLNKLYIRRLP